MLVFNAVLALVAPIGGATVLSGVLALFRVNADKAYRDFSEPLVRFRSLSSRVAQNRRAPLCDVPGSRVSGEASEGAAGKAEGIAFPWLREGRGR